MIRQGLLVALVLCLCACEREDRSYEGEGPAQETPQQVALSPLSPGPVPAAVETSGKGKEYEANAYHMSNGKRLFAWFNCTGCHANGGGGSGPALIDDRWIYGASIENIVETIRE